MARRLPLNLAYYALCWLTCVKAWSITWRNETGARVEHEDTGAQNCTRIYHLKGEEFSFDPEGQWCLNFWDEPECENRVGWSCDGKIWRKLASRNISAFDVYAMPPVSVSAYGLASTSTSTSSSTVATTSSTSPATATAHTTEPAQSENDSGSGSSLSGGAIAGIVVGVVAGVAILAVGFFFWGKRRRSKPASTAGAATDVPPPGPAVHPNIPEAMAAQKPTMSEMQTPVSPYYHPAGGKTVELPGDRADAELSASRQLQELEGDSSVKRF
ncbi:hypothetical protein BDV25DRAFT_109609 [Aspergillus avenaceus]|uniref:Mid2 domain-containing protein n=1 Tax=Aspergillus avenaceus TaxID=36643 RepID=A0A5N6U783_ASPAV|nr:hypothetical protein BDV25DRAFT_109609 [Aspergillus avenaceus]